MPRARGTAGSALVTLVLLGATIGCSRPVAFSARNLALITVDPLGASQLGCGGDPAARTPGWDRLARQGAQFRTAIASSPLAWTATATMLGGHHPFRHGLRGGARDTLLTPGPLLAESAGTATLATGAFGMLAARDGARGLDRGFDTFEPAAARNPESAVRAGLAWLDGVDPDRPFFLHVRIGEPEHPADASLAWAPRRTPGEVATADRALVHLLQGIDLRGRAHRTLVVATAAHAGPGSPGLDELRIRVPLVIWGPFPWRGGSLRPDLAAAIDICPTLLEAIRVAPDWQLPGRKLAKRLKPHREAKLFAYSEAGTRENGTAPGAYRSGAWKYVSTEPPRLHDLVTDPGERVNLAGREPERAADLAARMRTLVDAPPPRRVGG